MTAILNAEQLSHTYQNTPVLQNVNLSVEEGEFVAVMGQSGSGKSTLLFMLSGMDRPSSGNVTFKNRTLSSLKDTEMSRIRLNEMGFIFQNAGLINSLTVRDNITLPGLKSNRLPHREVLDRAQSLMEKTGISEVADHDISKISGGQLQRAAVCRALMNDPDILFGDEPTGALNRGATQDVMDIINRINAEGKTVVIVTHDAKVAARADRVIFLADGQIKATNLLGRYSKDEVSRSEREKQMSVWLDAQGF